MYRLLVNNQVISESNTFNEIADIFCVELLGFSSKSYPYFIAYSLFDEWCSRCDLLNKGKAQFFAWMPDGLIEVRYGKR